MVSNAHNLKIKRSWLGAEFCTYTLKNIILDTCLLYECSYLVVNSNMSFIYSLATKSSSGYKEFISQHCCTNLNLMTSESISCRPAKWSPSQLVKICSRERPKGNYSSYKGYYEQSRQRTSANHERLAKVHQTPGTSVYQVPKLTYEGAVICARLAPRSAGPRRCMLTVTLLTIRHISLSRPRLMKTGQKKEGSGPEEFASPTREWLDQRGSVRL
jgi:hypothetical protein